MSDQLMTAGLSERRLNYFFAAVTAGSIRAAADKIGIEPSVISRQIHALELELGIPLLERHGRGVKPTEAGRLIIDYYRQRLAGEEAMRTELEAIKGLQKGNVHIVASEGFIPDVINRVLSGFCGEYPEIQVTLEAIDVSRVIERIVEDRAHIGLAFSPPANPGIEVYARKRHPIHAIASPSHPVARRAGPLTLAELSAFPFALVPGEFGIGQITQISEKLETVSLRRAVITNSLAALKHYASTGLGLTLLPQICAVPELASGELIAVRVRSPLLETAEARLITRSRRVHSRATVILLERLRSMSWFAT